MRRPAQNLSAVLQALKDLELARLAAASRKQTELSIEIADFQRANMATQHRALGGDKITPSSIAGADTNWAGWLASQIEAKYMALARQAAEREQLVTIARRALGRAAAFEALLKKREKARRLPPG